MDIIFIHTKNKVIKMRERKSFEGPVFAFLIFILIGSILVGTPSDPTIIEPSYITINDECLSGGLDEDNDGLLDMEEDDGCHNFPYENGLGEIGTIPGSFDPNLDYQPYFDLTVDLVRGVVEKGCNGNLNGCYGTNFQNEVQFYCFYSQNVMIASFDNIFDKFFNMAHPNMPNDGSFTIYMNTCKPFPPSSAPTNLPLIEYQESNPIAENPGGSGGGK